MNNTIKKAGRPAKAVKGEMVWCPANAANRVNKLLSIVNMVFEYEKQLALIKNPSIEVMQALQQQYGIVAKLGQLQIIDSVLFSQDVSDFSTPPLTPTKQPEPTQDAPETPETGFKPAPMPAKADYDGTTSLDKVLASLYGLKYDTSNSTQVNMFSRHKTKARKALNIAAIGKDLSNGERADIYQWLIDNPQPIKKGR